MTKELAEGLILEMKDTSELMVDLAYSAVLYQSKDIAREVAELEEQTDATLNRLQRMIMELVQANEVGIDQALVIMRVAQTAEAIANAALDIADVVLRDVELHPVMAAAIRTSESTITRVEMGPGSEFLGSNLADVEFETETGMRILAVKRGPSWHTQIKGDFILEQEDIIIATGTLNAEDEFRKRCHPVGEPDFAAEPDFDAEPDV